LDTPRGLVDSLGLEQRLRFTTAATVEDAWLKALPDVTDITRSHTEIVVTGNEKMLFAVVSLLASHQIIPDRLQVDQSTLDDAFVAITGRHLESAKEES
jgi:ABC-2 type transport system ATP-binding protein